SGRRAVRGLHGIGAAVLMVRYQDPRILAIPTRGVSERCVLLTPRVGMACQIPNQSGYEVWNGSDRKNGSVPWCCPCRSSPSALLLRCKIRRPLFQGRVILPRLALGSSLTAHPRPDLRYTR